AGWSKASVTAFLALLSARGLVEEVPNTATRWRGQEAFFRACPTAPADAMERLAKARVLVAGLEPWGAAAAIELAAAGVGYLHMIDDAALRRETAAKTIRDQAPWCSVVESPMEVLEAPGAASGPWSLVVASVHPGDARQIELVARAAHRAGVV